MKKSFLLIAVLSFVFISYAQDAPDILGVWCSGNKDCKVQLYKNGNTIEGKVVWLLEEMDEHGKQLPETKNNKSKIGLRVLWDAVYNPITNYFENGIAYVRGHEFCGKFKLNKDGTLSVTGFICSLKFLRKTDTWTRVID